MLTCLIISGLLLNACGRKKDSGWQDTSDLRALAMQYMAKNQFDEAEATFTKAIQVSPDNILNYIGLARLYLLQKNYDDATIQTNAGLKIRPDNVDLELLLADIAIKKGNRNDAIDVLKKILDKTPNNVTANYTMANLGPAGSDDAWKKPYLLKTLKLAPANIVLNLQLAALYAAGNQTDSARHFMEAVKKISPDFSDAGKTAYDQALSLLQANQTAAAIPYIAQFDKLMKPTYAYSTASDQINIPEIVDGSPAFTSNLSNTAPPNTTEFLKGFKFTDASESTGLVVPKGLNATASVMAIADYDAEGNMYLYVSFMPQGASASRRFLFSNKSGAFTPCQGIDGLDFPGQDLDATFSDYDNDGFQDLFISTSKGIVVYKNHGDGTFSKVTDDIGLKNAGKVNKMLFADFDQDGDLDMYAAAKGGNKFFRNNGDGTFTETASEMGLSVNPNGTIDMDFGDWDSDGDLDIVALKQDGGLQLFNNNRHSKFVDISGSTGLNNPAFSGKAVAFGDYNNDGMLDIFVAGGADGGCSLLKNTGKGFVPDPAAKAISESLKGITVNDVAFLDFDNDGHQDILVAGMNKNSAVSGVRLFHNDGAKGFSDVSYVLPKTVMQANHIRIEDFNNDGDQDIFLSGPAGVQLIRNDSGNQNNFIQVQLTGLSYGNSKNNRLGIGAQIELKAGALYQMKTVTGPVTVFGVGSHTKLDAVRIIWPNGVPQTITDPSSNERILEQEQLKGSCPFLFTWNGEKYEFIKDMLWRSALGMPLAIHGKDTTYSFADASKEYLLIPGEKLKPKNGLYSIRITEELWEAVYFDKIGLVAVDHPDSIDTYVDERFVPPPFPGRTIHQVAEKHLPVSATDGKGNNLLPMISAYDFQYASNFSLGKYQGLAEDHDLILDLGDKAHSDSLTLFLRGWIFPTDASINTALTQTKKYAIHPPCLQVINKKGQWQTVIKNLGFPMGRDKMVIADLSDKFLTPNDRRVRISTDMQIYWDQIFFSARSPKAPVKMTDLKMTAASLNYRGYSASYRKGGPYGPEWFDYDHTTGGQKWRDLTGNYTRYGDVFPLLQKGDDEYVITDGGDQIKIDFDAKTLPPLAKGWKRDFLIYSEGWVKDGDLNTANGQTVAPLPFHNMLVYPYKNITYPDDIEHRAYQQKYNTRKVSTADFKNALRKGSTQTAAKSTP